MQSFVFKKLKRFDLSGNTSHDIKFRAKSDVVPYGFWVEGEFHRDGDFYIVDNYQIFKNSLQRYTGFDDDNGINIYEGDIVRGFYEFSYDEDGGVTYGSDKYYDFMIQYHKGNFYLVNDSEREILCEEYFLSSTPIKLFVIGNILDTREHDFSRNYIIDRLYSNFMKNYQRYYPELIELQFLEFVRDIYHIPMHDFACHFVNETNELRILFTLNGKNYDIGKRIPVEGCDVFTYYIYTPSYDTVESNELSEILKYIENHE